MSSEEKPYSDEFERMILNSLYEGEMTFSKAAEMLGVSKEKVKEMFGSFNWIPSSSYMQEIYEIEKEVLIHIEEEAKPTVHQTISYPQIYKLKTCDPFVSKQKINSGISIINSNLTQGKVIISSSYQAVQSYVSNWSTGRYQHGIKCK